MSSLWGQYCACSACDFRFDSNHSHETAGIEPKIHGFLSAVCTQCLQRYAIATASPWGPAEGEAVELGVLAPAGKEAQSAAPKNRRSMRVLRGTGVRTEFSEQWRLTKYIPGKQCPSCAADEAVAIDFMDGQACPRCKEGLLQCQRSLS